MLHVVVSSFGEVSDNFPVFGLPECIATSGLSFSCSGFLVRVESATRFVCCELHSLSRVPNASSLSLSSVSAASALPRPTLREAVDGAGAPWLELSRAVACLQPRLYKLCRKDEHWNEARWKNLQLVDGIPENEGLFRTGEKAAQVVVCEWGDEKAASVLVATDGSPLWFLPGMLIRKIVSGKDLLVRFISVSSFVAWPSNEGVNGQPRQTFETLDAAWENVGVARQNACLLTTILVQLRDEIEKRLPALPATVSLAPSSSKKSVVEEEPRLEEEEEEEGGDADDDEKEGSGKLPELNDGVKPVWKSAQGAVQALDWGSETFEFVHRDYGNVVWRNGLLLRRRCDDSWVYILTNWDPESGVSFVSWKHGEKGRILLFSHLNFSPQGNPMPSSSFPSLPAAYAFGSGGKRLKRASTLVTSVSRQIAKRFPYEAKDEHVGGNKGQHSNETGNGSAKRVRPLDSAASSDTAGKKKQKSDENLNDEELEQNACCVTNLAVVYSWGEKKEFFAPSWGVPGLHVKYKDKEVGFLHVKCFGPSKYKVWRSGEAEPATTQTSMSTAISVCLGSNASLNLRARFMNYVRKIFREVCGTRHGKGEAEEEEEEVDDDDEHEEEEDEEEEEEKEKGRESVLAKRRKAAASALAATDFSFDEDVALINVLQDACISGAAGTSVLVASCKEFNFPKSWILFQIRSSVHLHEKLRGRECNDLADRFGQLLTLLKDEILLAACSDPSGRICDFSFLKFQKRKYVD